MEEEKDALARLAAENDKGERERARYETECARIPLGQLNAYDVCRLWDPHGRAGWLTEPGTRAATLVKELGLPLMQVGMGRWVVTHTLQEAPC